MRVSLRSFLLIMCCGILVSGLVFSTEYWQKHVVSVLLYPFLVIENHIVYPVKQWFYWRQGVAELRVAAERFAKERDELLGQNIALQAQLDYVRDVAEVIDFKQRYEDTALTGAVLLKNFSPQEHFFLVGVGTSRGVKKDMVAVYKNNLIGRVSEVYPWFCKVVLITDKNCHVAATCTQTGAHGIHVGANNFTKTYLGFVNHLDTLQEGDLVISHGKGLVFPRGFALGRVWSYRQEGVQYEVAVKPLIDFGSIEFCTLIQKQD